MDKENLLALCYVYVSYLFREKNVQEKIKIIYLFGSVARGDFDKESDIDVFIDVEKKNEGFIKRASQSALKKLYAIEGKKWELKGIVNPLAIKVGTLEEWDLRESIEREGIILFGQSSATKMQKYLLFSLIHPQAPKKRIYIIRTLFGRMEKEYSDQGLVQKYNGKILSPRIFIVPVLALKGITQFLAEEKVEYEIEEIWK
ncbi:nucleotidyltransferase domain-containing protein [Candidatus Woesearchaeota archaeon]|nr:nucleotidyltransferase domain-containing protein [Candidatus Woesearchaeota archaeon]